MGVGEGKGGVKMRAMGGMEVNDSEIGGTRRGSVSSQVSASKVRNSVVRNLTDVWKYNFYSIYTSHDKFVQIAVAWSELIAPCSLHRAAAGGLQAAAGGLQAGPCRERTAGLT